MGAWSVDDKSSDTLVVVPGEGFWTGSSTLPHLHQFIVAMRPLGGCLQQRRPSIARLGGCLQQRRALSIALSP